jgi:hypothetical protein
VPLNALSVDFSFVYIDPDVKIGEFRPDSGFPDPPDLTALEVDSELFKALVKLSLTFVLKLSQMLLASVVFHVSTLAFPKDPSP